MKEKKRKEEKRERKKSLGILLQRFSILLRFGRYVLGGGRNLNRGGRDARVLLLRIPVGTGRDIIDLGGFSFFFFFEDKHFLLDCALLICLMAE